MAVLAGIAIIFFMLLSGSYFISSIVIPVGEIGKTARKIAHGNFSTRLEKKNDDEIGDLCEAINYMAEELGNTDKMKNEFISSVSHELRTCLLYTSCDAERSFELALPKAKSVGDPLPVGLVAYGSLPLMAFRNCPVRARIVCDACGQNGRLTDRKGVSFPVFCRDPVSYTHLLAVPSIMKPSDTQRNIFLYFARHPLLYVWADNEPGDPR